MVSSQDEQNRNGAEKMVHFIAIVFNFSPHYPKWKVGTEQRDDQEGLSTGQI